MSHTGEHRHALDALREDIAEMLQLLHLQHDGIVGLDAEQKIRFLNPAVEKIFGHPAAKLIGEPVRVLLSCGSLPVRLEPSGVPGEAVWEGSEDKAFVRLVARRRTGEEFPVEASISCFLYGGEQTLVVVFRDVTAQVQSERHLQYLAEHDPLTGLPNRAVFLDRLRGAIGRSRRHGWLTALLYIDLDRFKSVNDTLGHAVGDALLRAVATRLATAVRETDTLARLGGDELTAIMEAVQSPEAAMETADKLRSLLEAPLPIADRQIRITASIGIALCPDHGNDVDTLLGYAEKAMYAAKRQGAGSASSPTAIPQFAGKGGQQGKAPRRAAMTRLGSRLGGALRPEACEQGLRESITAAELQLSLMQPSSDPSAERMRVLVTARLDEMRRDLSDLLAGESPRADVRRA